VTSIVDDPRHVTIHLTAQATVEFSAGQLWPAHGDYSRFGADLASFATEVARRLHNDAYVGYCRQTDEISVIPLNAIKRIDFSLAT
jgi:hypothetical protein